MSEPISKELLEHVVRNSTQYGVGWQRICRELLDVRARVAELEVALRPLVEVDCYAGNEVCRLQDEARGVLAPAPSVCTHQKLIETFPPQCADCGDVVSVDHRAIGAGGGDDEGYIHPDVLAMQSPEVQAQHAPRPSDAKPECGGRCCVEGDGNPAFAARQDCPLHGWPRPSETPAAEHWLSDEALRANVEHFASCKPKYESNACQIRDMSREILRLRGACPNEAKACDCIGGPIEHQPLCSDRRSEILRLRALLIMAYRNEAMVTDRIWRSQVERALPRLRASETGSVEPKP